MKATEGYEGERGMQPQETTIECCQGGYSESDWVDFQLGTMDGKRYLAMQAHAAGCPECLELQERWSSLLEGDENSDSDPSDEERIGVGNGSQYPANKHYRALKREVVRLGRNRRRRSWVLLGGGLTAAVICLLLAGAVMKGGEHAVSLPAPLEGSDMRVLEKDPGALEVLLARRPDPIYLRPMPGEGDRGFIWLNADNSEAFLLLDDMPSASRSDYQVWLISGEQRDSLGLLKQIGTRGYLHFNTGRLSGTHTISVSAEPIGGSRYPTSDQTVLILYNWK
ncbi:anti-sigma factor [Paenibacillus chungangensis]|uniref:Anti-sigma factor n=1 Tax=Paenibacillus chungangensis TaxID=696535 RepID=A0ABW3HXN2_9BACL